MTREAMLDILRCGLAAPSAKNSRPWRFHVVEERRILDEVAVIMEQSQGAGSYVPLDPATGQPRTGVRSSVHESAAILRSVPAAIFIESTGAFSQGRHALLHASPIVLEGSIISFTFEAMGIGAAMENMWLAAVSHGLSGVFLGDVLVAEQAVCSRLGIENELAGALAIGHAEAGTADAPVAHGGLAPGVVRWVTE